MKFPDFRLSKQLLLLICGPAAPDLDPLSFCLVFISMTVRATVLKAPCGVVLCTSSQFHVSAAETHSRRGGEDEVNKWKRCSLFVRQQRHTQRFQWCRVTAVPLCTFPRRFITVCDPSLTPAGQKSQYCLARSGGWISPAIRHKL